MYCSFASGSDTEAAATALGLTIYDELDLPADYQTAKALSAEWRRHTYKLKDEVMGNTGTVHDMEVYFFETTIASLGNASAAGADFENVHGQTGRSNSNAAFYWLKIDDVKTLAESMGWKFYYAYAFQSISLETYDIPDPTVLHAPSGSRYPHEEDFNPNTYPAGTIFIGAFTLDFCVKKIAFVNSTGGNWKEAVTTCANSTDAEPGDISVIGYSDPFHDPDIFPYAFYQFASLPDELLMAMDLRHPELALHRKYALIQHYYSAGYTNNSVAFSLPLTRGKHSQDNYSALSLANAIDRWSTFYRNIPVEEETRSSATAVANINSGETVILYRSNTHDEIAPFWRTDIVFA